MYRMRDIARKGLAPPVLLLLCLLINIWARWPIITHIDEVFTISWRVCTALVIIHSLRTVCPTLTKCCMVPAPEYFSYVDQTMEDGRYPVVTRNILNL